MKLVNKTKERVVVDGIEELRTHIAKAKGLLGEKKEGRAVYFKTRFGIHTFGMKFPIDCAIVDHAGVVRATRQGMRPGRMFFWNPRWKRVIELPQGTLSRSGTELGDVLMLE